MTDQQLGYPSHPKLSDTDMFNVLRDGAPLDWFAPFAVLGEVRTSQPEHMRYGLVHAYYDADWNRQTDVKTFSSEEDARWQMEVLYRRHRKSCRCICVFYWTPAMVNYGPEAES